MLVKHFKGDRDETGVGDPSTVVSGLDFTKFVFSDLVHCGFVGSRVVLDGDQSGHTTHSSNLTPDG